MNETRPKTTSEQRMADLKALHRQLQELSSNRKCSCHASDQQTDRGQGAVLVIRGK